MSYRLGGPTCQPSSFRYARPSELKMFIIEEELGKPIEDTGIQNQSSPNRYYDEACRMLPNNPLSGLTGH
jgi:hypothetical protein